MSNKKTKKGSVELTIEPEVVIDVYNEVHIEAQRMLNNTKRPKKR
jgi:hypothetical protein